MTTSVIKVTDPRFTGKLRAGRHTFPPRDSRSISSHTPSQIRFRYRRRFSLFFFKEWGLKGGWLCPSNRSFENTREGSRGKGGELPLATFQMTSARVLEVIILDTELWLRTTASSCVLHEVCLGKIFGDVVCTIIDAFGRVVRETRYTGSHWSFPPRSKEGCLF